MSTKKVLIADGREKVRFALNVLLGREEFIEVVGEAVAADSISNEQLLELDVDLLIPAALENQITDVNAERIRAPIVVELANGPITSDADVILSENGKLIVPDILANAGGVTVSYFEWVQNKVGYY